MNVPGGVPPPRKDQQLQPTSRAGTGPAPQTNVFSRIIVVTGGTGGIFLYSPTPGTGNLIGSWTAAAGTDIYGNAYPAGINVTAGNLSGVTISALSEVMNPGPFILRGNAGLTISTFTTPGVNNWTAPAGVTSVQAYCWGAGGGGDGLDAGGAESGAGGGAFSVVTNVAVTPATVYHPTVGAGGTPNVNGGNSSFAGDVVTVTANGGQGASDPAHGNGGAASTTPAGVLSFAGGNGGPGHDGTPFGGGGGGSSASSGSAGNAGSSGTASAGGPGGASPAGFFAGGAGGAGGNPGSGGANGVAPGGGGGGAGNGGAAAGGTGANGQVVLVYSTGTLHTLATIASAAGTDPVTSATYNVGIESFEPVFGTSLTIDGANVTIGSAANNLPFSGGSLDVATVGQGLRVAEGTNAKQGTATLTAGTVTVANTNVTANSRIFLTAQTTGAGPGALRVSARTAGTSFVITSSNAADTSLVAYEIFEPG